MRAVAFEPHRHDDVDEDDFVVMHDVSWADYLRIMRERGDHSAPRIAYLEGTLEIMSPSYSHDGIKSMIGRLVETWCLERDIEFKPVGSWTVKDKRVARGVEPDECYVFGSPRKPRRPDLAIEVIWTSGSIDKLEIYRKLEVAEVWIWRDGKLTAYVLRGEHYEPVTKSRCLPGIDLQQILQFIDFPSASAAIRAYRDLLRNS